MTPGKTLNRLTLEGLPEALLGGLAYLNDTHVYNPVKYRINYRNFLFASRNGETFSAKIFAGIRSFLGRYLVPERHIKGTWPGFINYMPENRRLPGKSLLAVTDYNLFTTGSAAYPLFLFNDSKLPENEQIVTAMLQNTNLVISKHKRGKAYNFWLPRFQKQGHSTVGPVNLPVWIISLRWYINKLTGLFGLGKFRNGESLFGWVAMCYDKKINPTGSSAMVNIPDDADNTSNSVIFQALYSKRFNQAITDLEAMNYMCSFRDRNRKKDERWNKILYNETGAFLTWLKNERLPGFENPDEGIIPWHINNVDVIVNANVLYALELADMRSVQGYEEAVQLVVYCIENQIWPKTSVYYPERLFFPYYITRAWRDGKMNNPMLEKSLKNLLIELIEEQKYFENDNPEMKGVFPCGNDQNYVFSTGLFLLTLLNLGEGIADESGVTKDYRNILKNAVEFLIKNQQKVKSENSKCALQFHKVRPSCWKSGGLYSSSMQHLAVWHSNPQMTSLILEGLAKYALEYDNPENDFSSKQISIEPAEGKINLFVIPAHTEI